MKKPQIRKITLDELEHETENTYKFFRLQYKEDRHDGEHVPLRLEKETQRKDIIHRWMNNPYLYDPKLYVVEVVDVEQSEV